MIDQVRRAGLCVPLFSLRSRRSWGIGEIGDLPAAASWLRAASQSSLQILPLNELAPGESSPYSALSAMAIDPQFISIWMLDRGEMFEDMFADEIASVRRSQHVEYGGVRSLKRRALRASFERFLDSDWLPQIGQAAAFHSYMVQEAWWLDDYSLYRAIRAESGERPWTEWTAGLRHRDASALAAARDRLSGEVLYYSYVQWIAAGQWHRVRSAMTDIQILGDFPFMVTLDSVDVWSRPHEFMLDASVGTPPDAFSKTGQEWGLPPYNWEVAQGNNFEWLRLRARRLAELYDGFRVDHLVGFYRTYVRPLDGRAPYFTPADEDAQRTLGEAVMQIMIETGADVSVEDLGTVPDFVRASVARLGIPGYKVLQWEPDDPSMYPPVSVAMTGTHDTEPLAVWWESLGVEERRRFGFESPIFDDVVRDGILSHMYNAGSNLVLMPIQDVFGWRDRINRPATISDRNWTFALPWPIDEIHCEPDARERAERLMEWAYRTGRWSPPVEAE
jgi:4-alpha-glucanotransferase